MSRQSSDTTPAFYEILWERTKRPLVFVLVCLAAALALVQLQKEKTDIDKIENAPFYLVPKEFEAGHNAKMEKSENGKPNSYADQMKYVRIGYSNKLIEIINQNIDADYPKSVEGQNVEKPKDKQKAEKLKSLFLWNVSSLHHQYFVNEEEIIRAFYAAANKNKETDIKNLESKINKEFDENATNTAKFFDTSLKETTDLAKLTEKYDKDTTQKLKDPNGLVKEILDDVSLRPLNHSDLSDGGKLVSKIKTAAEEAEKTKLRRETALINSDYDYISGELFKTLKNKDSVKEIFAFSSPNPVFKNFMNTKTGLIVVYYLADITLKVIIVFGLLYVILIPLKHIFFITTSTDDLVDQSKKVFDKSAAATAASGLSRAILVTVTTIGIGAATLAGAISNSEAKDNPEASNLQPGRNLTDPRKMPPTNPPDGRKPLDPEALEALTQNIATLNGTVDNLKKEIEAAGLRTIPDEVAAIKKSLSGIESVVGKREDPEDKTTLLKTLIDVSRELHSGEDNIKTNLALVRGRLGEPNKDNPKTLFSKLEAVSNFIGDENLDTLIANPKAKPANLKQALSGIWASLGTEQYLDKTAHNGQSQSQANQSQGAKNVLQSIDVVDTKLGSTEKSINDQLSEFRNELENVKKDLKAVSTNIGNPNDPTSANSIFGYNKQIAAKTTQMGRFMIGESGGFRSLFAQLLLGEKYYITPMLIEDLKSPMLLENLKLQNKLPPNFPENDLEISEWNKNMDVLIASLKVEMSRNDGRKAIVSAKFLGEILEKTGFSKDMRSTLINYIREFSFIY